MDTQLVQSRNVMTAEAGLWSTIFWAKELCHVQKPASTAENSTIVQTILKPVPNLPTIWGIQIRNNILIFSLKISWDALHIHLLSRFTRITAISNNAYFMDSSLSIHSVALRSWTLLGWKWRSCLCTSGLNPWVATLLVCPPLRNFLADGLATAQLQSWFKLSSRKEIYLTIVPILIYAMWVPSWTRS